MSSTSGLPYFGRNCWTKLGKVSFSSRRDSAAIVSRQSDDFPEPDTPVKTVMTFFGILRETFFKLFSYAFVISINPRSISHSLRPAPRDFFSFGY